MASPTATLTLTVADHDTMREAIRMLQGTAHHESPGYRRLVALADRAYEALAVAALTAGPDAPMLALPGDLPVPGDGAIAKARAELIDWGYDPLSHGDGGAMLLIPIDAVPDGPALIVTPPASAGDTWTIMAHRNANDMAPRKSISYTGAITDLIKAVDAAAIDLRQRATA